MWMKNFSHIMNSWVASRMDWNNRFALHQIWNLKKQCKSVKNKLLPSLLSASHSAFVNKPESKSGDMRRESWAANEGKEKKDNMTISGREWERLEGRTRMRLIIRPEKNSNKLSIKSLDTLGPMFPHPYTHKLCIPLSIWITVCMSFAFLWSTVYKHFTPPLKRVLSV